MLGLFVLFAVVNADLKNAIADLELEYEKNANTEIAAGMAKYMKNLFPFYGIKKPIRTEIEKPFIDACKKLPFSDLEAVIKELWIKDQREFQYTAIVLLRASKIWKNKESLSLIEWLLVNKSWWDSVDAIAAHVAGGYLLAFPNAKSKTIDSWKMSKNMWLNRSAIIFQIKYKSKTDIPLLWDLCIFFAPQKEFFIKKAIGWALRELSYTEPDLVKEFVATKPLQNLSKTEALKAIKRKEFLIQ